MKELAKNNLFQISNLLEQINQDNYGKSIEILSGASIGQHVRHILEFYILLVSGSFTGIISYDKRKRDVRIEDDPAFAIETINKLISGMDTLNEQEHVQLEGDYSIEGKKQNLISSSVGRELAYCIEHSIHHQALIKTGLIALNQQSLINEEFGVAYSTIRYRNNSCAQ